MFPNGSQDEVFIVTSAGSTSQLLRYTYPGLTLKDTLSLPFPSPVGIAIEKNSVPARVAIAFAGGTVAVASINTNYDASLIATVQLGAGIADAPYWCSCPAGPQVGVAGLNGTLYVLATNLNLIASYAGVSPIRTTPGSDAVGEWFFGADDGYLHELQQRAGQSAMVQVAQYGGFGTVGSSVQVAGCPTGICVYLGSSSNAYLVPLDAREATLTACLSTSPPREATLTACLSNSPPACSGDNPRLWAQVEVGAPDSPQTVHVQGWSYYSP